MVAEAQFKQAMHAFTQAASQASIESNKFPASLRNAMDTLLMALARTMPHSSPDYLIRDEFLSDLAAVLPFHAHALHKLILKRILPLLREAMAKRLDGVYTEMRAEVDTESQHQRAAREQPVEEAKDPTTLQFRFSETLKALLYEAVKVEGDLILLDNMLAVVSSGEGGERRPIVPFLSPVTRKNIYRAILERGFASVGESTKAAINSARLSHEFLLVKRKQERLAIKELGIAKEAAGPGLKRKTADPVEDDALIDVVSVAGQASAKEPTPGASTDAGDPSATQKEPEHPQPALADGEAL